MLLRIHQPGLLATVQDLGRPAMAPFAVSACGAMDAYALQAANLLVGNAPDCAVIELTGGVAEYELTEATLLAVTGADLDARLDGRPVPGWMACVARPGARLTFGARAGAWGARAYAAIAGGIDVPRVLGSRSTYVPGGFGGLHGRALRTADELSIMASRVDTARAAGRSWPAAHRPAYRRAPAVRVLPGPHADLFDPAALRALVEHELRITPTSNRMGYRFEDCPALGYARALSLPSLGIVPGVIQVPPDGSPILLGADAQTTGGYPIIAVAIQADLPLAAQCLPGDPLRFQWCTREEAVAALRAQRDWLAQGPDVDEWEPVGGN